MSHPEPNFSELHDRFLELGYVEFTVDSAMPAELSGVLIFTIPSAEKADLVVSRNPKSYLARCRTMRRRGNVGGLIAAKFRQYMKNYTDLKIYYQPQLQVDSGPVVTLLEPFWVQSAPKAPPDGVALFVVTSKVDNCYRFIYSREQFDGTVHLRRFLNYVKETARAKHRINNHLFHSWCMKTLPKFDLLRETAEIERLGIFQKEVDLIECILFYKTEHGMKNCINDTPLFNGISLFK